MEKIAQKRSVLDWIKEKSNVSGISAEKFFNPEFQRVMESLRENDDAIRSIISGESIGASDPGDDPISLKDLLKSAKSNFNRREYMTSVADLGRFHKKLYDVVQIINKIDTDVDQIHHDFLFKELDEEQKKYLHDLKTRLASRHQYLLKEASIMDFFINIGTKRGRALAAWEKRYPQQIGKLKRDTDSLLKKSEVLLSNLLSSLKEMSGARSSRHVDNYVKAAHKIVKSYQNYDKTFKDYYNSNIKGFLEKQELIAPSTKVEDAKEMGKQEVPATPKFEAELNVPKSKIELEKETVPKTEAIPLVKEVLPTSMLKEVEPSTLPSSPPKMSEPSEEEFPSEVLRKELSKTFKPQTVYPVTTPTGEEPPHDTEINYPMSMGPSPKAISVTPQKQSQRIFLTMLQSLSKEDPKLLAHYIKKYAKSIKEQTPEIAIQLLKIAQLIGK